jgi:hypothetical protein
MPFPAFLMPMLIGAGTGALGGLLTGKDPLKGALIGGVTGGLLGPMSGAIGAGGVGAGAASASSAGATGLVGAGNSALSSGIGSGLGGGLGGGAGSYVAGGNPAAYLAQQPASLAEGLGGMQTAITPNGAATIGSGEFLAPNMGLVNTEALKVATPQAFVGGNSMLTDPALGGINPLSSDDYAKIASMPAESSSSFFGDIYDKVSPYVDIRDIGSTALKSQLQSQPRQQISPQSGRVTEGRAPQGNDVMALLQSIKMPDRRRITLL